VLAGNACAAAASAGSITSSCVWTTWPIPAALMTEPSRAILPIDGASVVASDWLVATISRARAASVAVNAAGSPSGLITPAIFWIASIATDVGSPVVIACCATSVLSGVMKSDSSAGSDNV